MIQISTTVPDLPTRNAEAHKGQFGHGMIVGGAVGMAGAIGIAGMACLRSGVGLLTLGVPKACLDVVAAWDPCYMTLPLECDANGRLTRDVLPSLQARLPSMTCLAIGPGLGRSKSSDEVVLELFQNAKQPMVVDADALNALSEWPHWSSFWSGATQNEKPVDGLGMAGERILTPHPGEWQRLSGVPASDRGAQIEAANRLASLTGWVIVLKGHKTWVTDGIFGYENTTGNPSMAAGGSGDSLTGIITSFVCQGMKCMHAAQLGVYLHGLAGDLASEELGTPSSTPLDLIHFLPKAFRTLARSKSIPSVHPTSDAHC